MPPSADVVGPGAGDAADTKSSSPGAVRVSPSLVETSEFGGTFEVFCEALDAQGQKLKDPGDWQIDFSPHQPMKMGEIFASAKSGTLTVTCSSLQANVKVSTELEVASEGLDPAVPGLAKKLLTAVDKVNFVLNKPTDEVNQAESIKELKAMLTKWDAGFVASKEGLLDVGQKLPTLAQVKAAGIPASADDGPWVTQLNKVQKLADGVIDLLKKTPSTASTTDLQHPRRGEAAEGRGGVGQAQAERGCDLRAPGQGGPAGDADPPLSDHDSHAAGHRRAR